MTNEPRWRRYLRLWGPDVRGDIDDEIEFHLALLAERHLAAGASPEEARAQALREFGDAARARELCREIGEERARRARRAERLGVLRQDLRYAARTLARRRGFAAVALLTLALGIGASTAIFGAVEAVLLRPLPFAEPERLVRLWEVSPQGDDHNVVSDGNYLDWRARAASFAELGAHGWTHGVALVGDGEPAQVMVTEITPSVLRVLGVAPLLGRPLTDEDARGDARVVLLSYALWRGRFGEARDIVGRRIVLDEVPHTVVGVMPQGFRFPAAGAELWRPIAAADLDPTERRGHNLYVVGRLKPGVTLEGARAELSALAAALGREHPATGAGWGASVLPLHGDMAAAVRPLLLVLLGGALVVLLVTCANIASLLLARAVTREREMAVRGALGARRGRLVRQLLTESALLAAAGGLLGVVVAAVVLRLLVALAPADVPLLDGARLDPVALAFAAAATLASTLLFGLAPALRLAGADLQSALRASHDAGGVRHARLRQALLVAEVALSLVLLAGASLLARSFLRMREVDYGFRAAGLAVLSLDLPRSRYPDTPEHVAFYERLLARLAAVRGVAAVAGTDEPPVVGNDMTFSFAVQGRPSASPSGREDPAPLRVVTPAYFRTMGIPLLRGRAFDDRDRAGAPAVVLLDRAAARKYFPGEDPVGRRISFDGAGGPWLEIVGVVGDTRMASAVEEPVPSVYLPYAQKRFSWISWMAVMVRPAPGTDLRTLAPRLRAAVWEVDAQLPIRRLATVEALFAESTARHRLATTLLGAFAALALLLGATGMYGVIAFTVAQRRRELGIRLALGAGRREVVGMVLRQALALTLLGVAAGTAAALALTRVLRGLLYRVSPTDPLTLAGVALLLALIAAAAAWVPARRAARIDPLLVMRDG